MVYKRREINIFKEFTYIISFDYIHENGDDDDIISQYWKEN